MASAGKAGMLILPILFFVPFVLVGVGLLGFGLWSAGESALVSYWPMTEGEITNLAINQRWSGGEGQPSKVYEVKVEYIYTVADTTYSGSCLAFGYSAGGVVEANEIYQKLASARSVQVHYDPADPGRCALAGGVHRSIQFVLAFAVMWLTFVVGALTTICLWARSNRELIDHLSVR